MRVCRVIPLLLLLCVVCILCMRPPCGLWRILAPVLHPWYRQADTLAAFEGRVSRRLLEVRGRLEEFFKVGGWVFGVVTCDVMGA